MVAGSWQTDPTGRHLYRYHDGEAWTDQVADGGAATTDPYDDGLPPPLGPTPPADAPDATPSSWPSGSSGSTPIGSAPADDAAWSGDPGWSGGSGGAPVAPTWSPSGGGGGWSTGARIGVGIAVLAAMVVSGVIGFAIGAATSVVDELDGFPDAFDLDEEFGEDFGVERLGPDDVPATGATLSSDQPRFEDALDGASAIDVRVTRQSVVTLEVVEADFDTYLLLYDATGSVVGSDDDSGSGLLSRLEAELEPGTYTLVVESFSGEVDAGERIELVADFDTDLG